MEFAIKADNSAQVLAELQSKIQNALEECGIQAVSHAQQIIGSAGRVDTGALQNSVNFKVEDKTCHIGTNLEYAIYNEMGTGIYIGGGRTSPWAFLGSDGEWHRTRGMAGIHFLKNAVADNIPEYKNVIEKHLKGN